MGRIDELAKQYVEAESKRRERTVGMKLTDYEKDLVVETFKYAYRQAERSRKILEKIESSFVEGEHLDDCIEYAKEVESGNEEEKVE